VLDRCRFILKVSRPGLWFQTLWLYLLPVAAQPRTGSWAFWLGAVYVLFPLNLLVYGWNDFVDREIDRVNPRKDSFLFGARGTPAQLASLPLVIAGTNLPFFALLAFCAEWKMGAVLVAILLVLALYNLPRHGLRGRPPLELLNQLGYLLILPLSILLNGTPRLPWQSVLYLVLFCTHAHLMGEIMDVHPDRAAGRRTTATVLGPIPVKAIVMGLVLVESALMGSVFRDYILAAFLFLGACWMVLDMIVFRARSYTPDEFLLFGAALNVVGFASIAWVWFTGTLTRLPVSPF
jgi:4-hydroxybenzoate polyprenyltransferase